MHEADRTLELCAAAVYLAEAEWRAGDPDAADRAADLALATAGRLGTQHALLGALRAFPGVLSRRLGGLTGADSPWHSLGRPLLAPAAARPGPRRPRIRCRWPNRRPPWWSSTISAPSTTTAGSGSRWRRSARAPPRRRGGC